MCGIAGYVGTEKLEAANVSSCQELMTRRGPDATGYFEQRLSDGTMVQFLHSRLSILDLDSRSDQPLTTSSSAIVMNGEIYNFIEIRKELAELGVEFFTEGDTEVAALLLEHMGPLALPRFEAMFALAWIDKRSDTCILARDRFGEKPLLVLRSKEGLFFGSDVQYLIALSGRSLNINEKLLARFLVNGYKDIYKHDQTFFSGVERVPAGAALIRDKQGSWKTAKYFHHDAQAVDETLTFDEAVDETYRRVTHAIELRLRADVPIALCLSGGIDSNLLMGITQRVLHKEVQAFSIVGSDPRYDETVAIRSSAAWFGIEPHIKTMTGFDALTVLEEITRERGAPVATANQFALWSLMQEISSSGFKVAISGLGADELFTGYYDHHLYYMYELRHSTPEFVLKKTDEWEELVRPLLRNPYMKTLTEDPRRDPSIPSLVFGDTMQRLQYLRNWAQDLDLSWTEEHFEDDLLRNRMANELWHESVPLTLYEEDRNAMYWSVENRSPYLDSRLLSWSRTVPIRHFIQNGRAKALLRAAGAGIVPEQVLQNPQKTGFNLSVSDLLPNNRQEAVNFIGDSPLSDFLDMGMVSSLLASRQFNDSDNKFAFSLLASAAFTRVFGGF